MKKGVRFDHHSAKRIAENVKRLEHLPRGTDGVLRRKLPTELHWFSVFNSDASDAPAGALLPLTGGSKTIGEFALPTIEKPGNTLRRLVAVANPLGIKANAYGLATFDGPVDVAYTGAPSTGDGLGAKPGQWIAAAGYPTCIGFIEPSPAAGGLASCTIQPVDSLIGKLTADLSPAGSATVNVWAGAAGSEATVSGMTITAWDYQGRGAKSGSQVVCKWLDGFWYIVAFQSPALQIFGTLAATITASGSGTCNVAKALNGISPGATVTVYETSGVLSGSSGQAFHAIYNADDGKYYFVWIQC